MSNGKKILNKLTDLQNYTVDHLVSHLEFDKIVECNICISLEDALGDLEQYKMFAKVVFKKNQKDVSVKENVDTLKKHINPARPSDYEEPLKAKENLPVQIVMDRLDQALSAMTILYNNSADMQRLVSERIERVTSSSCEAPVFQDPEAVGNDEAKSVCSDVEKMNKNIDLLRLLMINVENITSVITDQAYNL